MHEDNPSISNQGVIMSNLLKATFLLVFFAVAMPTVSFAEWSHHGRHHRDYGHHGHNGSYFHASYHDGHSPFFGINLSLAPERRHHYRSCAVAPTHVVYRPIYQPVYVEQTPPVAVKYENSSTGGYLAVNVPSKRGGYTTVQLKRITDGFLGPQGEFYSEFPTVGQLQAIYG
jgi:hypothetical protein